MGSEMFIRDRLYARQYQVAYFDMDSPYTAFRSFVVCGNHIHLRLLDVITSVGIHPTPYDTSLPP